jgi:hypothetical protein
MQASGNLHRTGPVLTGRADNGRGWAHAGWREERGYFLRTAAVSANFVRLLPGRAASFFGIF